MKLFLYSILFLFFYINLSAQTVYDDDWTITSSEDDECYRNAFETDLYEFEDKEYFVFTGEELTKNRKKRYLSNISTVTIRSTHSKSKWTRVCGNYNCLSADPNDCLFDRRRANWYGLRSNSISIVKDTNQVKDFEKRLVTTARLIKKRNGIVKVRVLCGEEITDKIQESIIQNLQSAGFLGSGFTKVHDTLVKEALFQYQVHNGLPLGYLDYETLKSLKVI